jgi:hypothetical protein
MIGQPHDECACAARDCLKPLMIPTKPIGRLPRHPELLEAVEHDLADVLGTALAAEILRTR